MSIVDFFFGLIGLIAIYFICTSILDFVLPPLGEKDMEMRDGLGRLQDGQKDTDLETLQPHSDLGEEDNE